VIGNREDAAGAGALVTGDAEVADDALVGAAALALD
jgi:serine acetyltransferase